MKLKDSCRIAEDALAKLAALGSADNIALHLAERGVRGPVWCPESCVLAEYLYREFGLTGLIVSHTLIEQRRSAGSIVLLTEVPVVITDFIEKFDDLHYPDLIAKIDV